MGKMKTFPPPNTKQFRSVCPHHSTLDSFSFTFLISYHDPPQVHINATDQYGTEPCLQHGVECGIIPGAILWFPMSLNEG